MKRIVQPELLDALPPDNPRAMRSRRDLRRINRLMGSAAILVRHLEQNWPKERPVHITEIGAGDGNMMAQVVRQISSSWPRGKVTLLDLQATVAAETLQAFERLNWEANVSITDVFKWSPMNGEIVFANLFLHHFGDDQLVPLLHRIAAHASLFIAMEPRRAQWPLFCSRLLWAIGCNDVTRHDAVVSVRAGFCGDELSLLWPGRAGWYLTEQGAGLFSHLFMARKIQ